MYEIFLYKMKNCSDIIRNFIFVLILVSKMKENRGLWYLFGGSVEWI